MRVSAGGSRFGLRCMDRHVLEGLFGLAQATLADMAVAMTVLRRLNRIRRSPATAVRNSFSASSSSWGVPAPRLVSARWRARFCWAFSAGDLFLDDRRDFGDGLVGHLSVQTIPR